MHKLTVEQRAALGRNVYSHPTALYYKDQHYYDSEGEYLFSNDGVPAPPGAKARTLVGGGSTETPPESVASGEPEDPRKALEAKTPSQLLKLMRMAEAPADQIPAGPGAKAKAVDWLLANTKQ